MDYSTNTKIIIQNRLRQHWFTKFYLFLVFVTVYSTVCIQKTLVFVAAEVVTSAKRYAMKNLGGVHPDKKIKTSCRVSLNLVLSIPQHTLRTRGTRYTEVGEISRKLVSLTSSRNHGKNFGCLQLSTTGA